MKIDFNIDLLKEMIDTKMVRVSKHTSANLWIYNYTEICQFSRMWNDVTSQCRGLILDDEFNIVARPFRKFHNYEELDPSQIPNLPFEVYQKMDGSLGIMYWINDVPYIATRGSFESEQAIHATKILHKRLSESPNLIAKYNRDATHLFEIIYPENRIVVNYGNFDNLIMLAIIDNRTGRDLLLHNGGFPIVKKYDGLTDLNEILELQQENEEGFVIKFSNDFRVKIKFDEYKRLHKIITGTSTLSIWESLMENNSLEKLLEDVPDEFYNWTKETSDGLYSKYHQIERDCKESYRYFDNRKEAAEYFKTQKYPHILFKMMDGKDYSKDIWKLIRPVFSKAFANEAEIQ